MVTIVHDKPYLMRLYRFDGGLDDVTSPWILPANVMSELNNADLSETGLVKKAKGKSRFISTSLGANPIKSLYICTIGTTKYYICSYTTTLKYSSNGTSWSSLATGLTDADWYFVNTPTWLYCFNGTENRKWDGTSFLNFGIAAPANAPTKNSNINGSLTASRVYYYKYTYYNSTSGVESDPSPASAALTASADPNDGFKLNLTGSSDAQVDKIKVYRTYGNTAAPFWYEGIVNNAAGTVTYDSTTADASLSTTQLYEKQAQAPAAKYPILHGGRLFLVPTANTNQIIFSEPAPYLEYFPAYNVLYTPNLEPIVGMASSQEDLYVFTENSINVLNTPFTESPESAWSMVKVVSTGCSATKSIVATKNYIFYLGKSGIMAFDGTSTQCIKELPNLNQNYIGLSCACYHNERLYFAVPEGDDTTPDQLYELILKTGAWIKHPDIKAARVMQSSSNVLYAGDVTNGLVYKFFDGEDNDGAAFEFSLKTGYIDFGDYTKNKTGIKLFIPGLSGTGTFDIYIEGHATHEVEDVAISDFRYYKFEQGMHGQAYKLGISHSSKTAFEIAGLSLLYRFLGDVN